MPEHNLEQIALLTILSATMVAFIWGRWRYDVVALTALLVAALGRLIPSAEVFTGFGHPAVITVAAVLVISRALNNSGAVDQLTSVLRPFYRSPGLHIFGLSGLVGAMSGFMNNVGALALTMPMAIKSAREAGTPASRILMPLSFASILGGLVTLIGTPPNIIISAYREETTGEPFALFDFMPVGLALALGGIVFVALIGWRLLPQGRSARASAEKLFDVQDYVVEARIEPDSPLIGEPIAKVAEFCGQEVKVVAVQRGERNIVAGARYTRLQEADILVLIVDADELSDVGTSAGLVVLGSEDYSADDLRSDEVGLTEAIVTAGSRLAGRTAAGLRLARRYNMNLIGIARQGQHVRGGLENTRLRPGDVLLLQGPVETLAESVGELGGLPLAERGLKIEKRPNVYLPLAVFAGALLASGVGLAPIHISFCAAVIVLIAVKAIGLRELYTSIDWRVIVLLGSMIPLGRALETSGATETIATGLLGFAGDLGPVALMTILLVITMTLSDVMNNAATAVVMAPIASTMAAVLNLNADPFLMAVAIGASCAFLTPIGHQNNVLVMGPGGYRFGDYWRMGLPLEILIVAAAAFLIPLVWPFS